MERSIKELITTKFNKLYYNLKDKTVAEILSEYRSIPETQFQHSYLIKFNKDGTVFDTQNKVCYSTLKDWAVDTLSHIGEHYE